MMEPVTLPATPADGPATDYAALKLEGTRLVQLRSGRIWTDYNESDPGVTTLEQLCYALTELSYRAGFSVADLLTAGRGEPIDARRQALYPARAIFPVNPVTPGDYRKLLIDRVPGVGNAWMVPVRPHGRSPRAVHGLWDLYLYAPGVDPVCARNEAARVVDAARRVYAAHRNLCEDLRRVVLLEPVPVTVNAHVALRGGAAPDDVLARILFRLGGLFAPEPQRHPLDEEVEAGRAPSAIFEGPLLRNGFVHDDELQPMATSFPVSQVSRTVAGTAGVTAVTKLSVTAGGRTHGADGSVPVPRGAILRLATATPPTLRLYCNGVEVSTDPAAVRRKLDRLWEAHRQTWPLDDQYDDFFAMPTGEFRDLRRYDSVQNQYPATYAINAYGLPHDAPAARRAQAKQLKGYLLPFEQLLADYFAQLAHARDLFSTLGPEAPDGRRSYWFQYLDRDVPDVAPLLSTGPDGYRARLPEIVAAYDPWVERRASFLAFLLGMYADGLDAGTVAGPGGDACGGGDPAGRQGSLYRARLALIRRLVESTHDRFRAVDLLRRPSPRNEAGMETRCRIQLGMPVDDRRPLAQALEEAGVELRPDAPDGGAGEWHAEGIEQTFEAIPPASSPGPGPAGAVGAGGGRTRIPEALLDAAPGDDDLRVGAHPDGDGYAAAARDGRGWRLLGRYPARDDAAEAGRSFAGALAHARRHARQLYIVENVLLRSGRCRPPVDAGFAFGQTITAVFVLPRRLRDDESYQAFAREVVRANAPAHLAVEYRFLSAARGVEFEALHRAWRQALETGRGPRLRATSARMRAFLREADRPAPSPVRRRRGED